MSKQAKIRVTAGLDGGNNSLKLDLGNGNVVQYDNIFAPRIEVDLEKEYMRNGKRVANKFNIANMLDVSIKSGERENSFIFGNQAQKYRTNIKERVNNYKSDDEQLALNSLVALTNTVIANLDKENWEEELNIEVNLCTGLPFHEYETGVRQDKYKKLFVGNHEIKFLNPSYPVKKVNLTVKDVELEIEGLAALKQTIFDKGIMDSNHNQIIGKIVSMIDIGCYTTDIVGGIFVDDIDEEGNPFVQFDTLSEVCKGIIQGVGTAADNTIKRLKSDNASKLGQYDDFTRQDIFKATSNNGIIPGTDFNIEPTYSEECRKIGNDIGNTFAQLIDASGFRNKLLKIYIAGGGSYVEAIVNEFKKVFEEKGFSNNLIDIVDNPVYANANGYFNIADTTFN